MHNSAAEKSLWKASVDNKNRQLARSNDTLKQQVNDLKSKLTELACENQDLLAQLSTLQTRHTFTEKVVVVVLLLTTNVFNYH